MKLTEQMVATTTKDRNANVEVFRAIALLAVLFYHCWTLASGTSTGIPFVDVWLPFGGALGVTGFFVLSGYGIFRSLDRHPVKDFRGFKEYFLRRFRRIAPQYYLSLIVVLFLSEGVYFSNVGIGSIISHIFFVHNFVISWHGAINGALWTMGITIQFYLVAPLLYFFVRRFTIQTMAISILITVLSKIIIFGIVPISTNPESLREWMLFIYGRQLISSLDNFMTGMTVAFFVQKRRLKCKGAAGAILLGLALICLLCRWGSTHGVNSVTCCGYIWHTLLALDLGVILFALHTPQTNNKKSNIKRALQKLAHYEYGIYVWHLPILNNLLANSEWVQRLINSPFKNAAIPILTGILIVCGITAEKLLTSEK